KEINRLCGEAGEFEVMYNDLLICGNYDAEYREVQGGDHYYGIWEMVSELVSESVVIGGIYDEEGDELQASTSELQIMFN
ncbi:MAG: hypothetical protein RR005_07710, partial [Mucinivorans sp.]